jgi:hypothetical protein
LPLFTFFVASSRRVTVATNSEGEVLDIHLDNAQDANGEKYIDKETIFASSSTHSQ